jgi:hypothetical protein
MRTEYADLILASKIYYKGDGIFLVPSETEEANNYEVNLWQSYCPCNSFRYNHTCKHLKAAALATRLANQWTFPTTEQQAQV